MEKFKQILKKIFCLPPMPTLLLAVFGYALIILVAALHIDIEVLQYLAYISSAYALIVTITGFHYLIDLKNQAKRYINESAAMRKVRSTKVGNRYLSDMRFRTEISLYQGLFINILYIAMKLFSGIYYRSVWFIALAIYYILLAVMRFVLLKRGKRRTGRTPMEEEIHRYRLCGVGLLVMNQALAGIVIFMVKQNEGFNYHGLLIYAMAVYSFYAVISSVAELVKLRKHGSPVVSAAKTINLVAAMVSMLSLETAMIARFGGEAEEFRAVMTGATGGGVCVIVIGMAIFMIVKSSKTLKSTYLNKTQT